MRRGQGLLEVTIAIGVLAALTFGMAGLLIQSDRAGRFAFKRVQGIALAEEGLEAVREKRDTNFLAEKDFWEGLTNIQNDGTAIVEFIPETGSWQFNFSVDEIADARAEFADVPIAGVGEAGFWIQGAGAVGFPVTGFSRLIELSAVCADADETGAESLMEPGKQCPAGQTIIGIEISSAVEWRERGQTASTVLTTRVYGWK